MSLATAFQWFICLMGLGLFGALLQLIAPDKEVFHSDTSDRYLDSNDDRYIESSTDENTERYLLEETVESQNQTHHEHHHHYNDR